MTDVPAFDFRILMMMMMMMRMMNRFHVFLAAQHSTTGSPVSVASMSLTTSRRSFVVAVNCVQVLGSGIVLTLGETD